MLDNTAGVHATNTKDDIDVNNIGINNETFGIDVNKMRPRDPNEPHRTATELELLFDLVYVIAVSAAASGLHHNLAQQHIIEGLIEFLLAFGVLWNAWSGFTWFASGYDPKDLPYRISVLFQMFGSLMIAANISHFFEQGLTWVGVSGYVIMRVALLSQWGRVYHQIAAHRKVAGRHIIGLIVLQSLWVSWLFIPSQWQMLALILFMGAELVMPIWAHAGQFYSWNPAHIAERYGLLVIIVLGEGILSSSGILNGLFIDYRESLQTIFVLSSGAVALSFFLWWLYFSIPFAKMLYERRTRLLLTVFNYAHIGVFASLASLGSALDLVADSMVEHQVLNSPTEAYVMLILTVIVVIYLCLIALLRAVLCQYSKGNLLILLSALIIVAISYIAVNNDLHLGYGIWLMVLAPVVMITGFSLDDKRQMASIK